jgi:hypothetical protein
MSRNLKPVHEHPRRGQLGEPLMLSRGDVKLVITPTRVLDPLNVGAADLAVGGHDNRFVGLEVRTTNVGHKNYGLSAEDVKLLTARNNAALPTDLVRAGDCLSESAADPDPVVPGSTTTACYPTRASSTHPIRGTRAAWAAPGAGLPWSEQRHAHPFRSEDPAGVALTTIAGGLCSCGGAGPSSDL